MKVGANVRQVVPTIQGEVTATNWNDKADCQEVQVRWTDANGDQHERWFLVTEVEEVLA